MLDNPFEDIVPRITPKERKEQDKAKREMKVERAKQRELAKRKGTKRVESCLSYWKNGPDIVAFLGTRACSPLETSPRNL